MRPVRVLWSQDVETQTRGYWAIGVALHRAGCEVVLGGAQTPAEVAGIGRRSCVSRQRPITAFDNLSPREPSAGASHARSVSRCGASRASSALPPSGSGGPGRSRCET